MHHFAALITRTCFVSALVLGCDADDTDDETQGTATDGSGGSGSSPASAGSGNSGSGGSDSADSDSGGSDPSASGGSDSAASTTGDTGDDPHQACVDRINMFRATLDLPPYERWAEAEGCTDDQARDDAEAGGLHPNFGACGEYAQNTCPGWGSLDSVLIDCLQVMWDEGPGEDFNAHGHFLNMSSTQYMKVACGFHESTDGSVYSNQNFQ